MKHNMMRQSVIISVCTETITAGAVQHALGRDTHWYVSQSSEEKRQPYVITFLDHLEKKLLDRHITMSIQNVNNLITRAASEMFVILRYSILQLFVF